VKHPKDADGGEKVGVDTRQKKKCNMKRGNENFTADKVRYLKSGTRKRRCHSVVKRDEHPGHRRN